MVAFNVTTDSFTTREQLDDLIDIQTPADAPLHSLLGEEFATDTYFDWSIDEIASPTAVAVVAENQVFSQSASEPEPQRLSAPVCIVLKGVEISGSRRQVNTAGMDDAYNYHLEKKCLEAIKQMEVNMHFGKAGTAVKTANTARTCEGLVSWLAEASQGATIVGIDFAKDRATYPSVGASEWAPSFHDANGTALTRNVFHDSIITPGWQQGMNIEGSIILCGSTVKRLISEFANVYASATAHPTQVRNTEASDKILVETIDFFASDFGVVGISLDRYMDTATTDVYLTGTTATQRDESLVLIEADKFSRMTFRGLHHQPLSKTADGTRGQVVYEAGIKCYNPLGGIPAFQLVA